MTPDAPGRIIVIGGGAAGFCGGRNAAPPELWRSIVMLSNDTAAPVDRPNLSKDYLAGSAPEDWLPLRPDGFYLDNEIELRLNAKCSASKCVRAK